MVYGTQDCMDWLATHLAEMSLIPAALTMVMRAFCPDKAIDQLQMYLRGRKGSTSRPFVSMGRATA